jgi:hypothetical protein
MNTKHFQKNVQRKKAPIKNLNTGFPFVQKKVATKKGAIKSYLLL